jgi:hypothetical protein
LWVPHTLLAVDLSRFLSCGVIRLAADDRFESSALGLHADVAVMPEHAFGDVTGDVHDGLIAGPTFRKIRDERVAIVVPSASDLGILADVVPGRLEGGNGPGRIARAGLPKGEDVPFGASFAELLPVPDGILPQDRKQRGVEGNRPAFSGLCLALAHDQIALREFDLRPGKRLLRNSWSDITLAEY